jgi:dienelactone hydrolase
VTGLLLPYLHNEHHVTKIGFAGFCFGGFVGYLISQLPGVLMCAAGIHSSIRIFNMHGSNEAEATLKVTCPQMLLQAGNDNANGKPGSEVHQLLSSLPFGDACVLREFPDMLHGWALRGDINDPIVARDVQLAINLVVEFLNTHVR